MSAPENQKSKKGLFNALGASIPKSELSPESFRNDMVQDAIMTSVKSAQMLATSMIQYSRDLQGKLSTQGVDEVVTDMQDKGASGNWTDSAWSAVAEGGRQLLVTVVKKVSGANRLEWALKGFTALMYKILEILSAVLRCDYHAVFFSSRINVPVQRFLFCRRDDCSLSTGWSFSFSFSVLFQFENLELAPENPDAPENLDRGLSTSLVVVPRGLSVAR